MIINNIIAFIYFKLELISFNENHYYYCFLLKCLYTIIQIMFCKLLKIKCSEDLTINIDTFIINITQIIELKI